MIILKPGQREMHKRGQFQFKCKRCGCEWEADRGDKELKFSPPCEQFYAYMDCPNCGNFTTDR